MELEDLTTKCINAEMKINKRDLEIIEINHEKEHLKTSLDKHKVSSKDITAKLQKIEEKEFEV